MEDGISETLHIASMGIDYTFKIVSGSSKLLLDFIKYVCNKAVLSQKEKAALQQMMRASANACVQINKADVKNFDKLLSGHGVKYTKFTPVTSSNKKPGYTNFSFDIAQVDLVNVCLREINYAEFVNKKVGDGKNAGASNRSSREPGIGSGGAKDTEEQGQIFDGYEFSSNYTDEDFHVPGSDRVVQNTPVSEKKTESPTVDAFSFLSSSAEASEVVSYQEMNRDRIPLKNVVVAAKEEYEEVQKASKQAHMDPPDLSLVDGILARAKDKNETLEKERREAAVLVKEALVNGVAAGKEALK